MRYIKPNLKFEWEEAKRYPEFLEMGIEGWLHIGKKGKPIQYSTITDEIGNVDLNFNDLEKEKKDRFYDAFDKGVIEMPIAVKFGESNYDLVAGNTRLSGLLLNKRDPFVWIVDLSEESEINEDKLKGGNTDEKTLEDIAKKHDKKGYYHVDDMVKSLKKQVKIGLPIELDHTDDKDIAMEIVKDHLWEDPNYYTKLKKVGVDENKQFSPPPQETETYDKIMGTKHTKHNPYDMKEQGADSSGSFEGAAFGQTILKRDLHKLKTLPNAKKYEVTEKEKIEEQMTADVSAGAMFDVPAFGKTTKGGRKNPLAIDGPKSIAKSRAVTDPNFPKWGGPGGVFIKIKEKCKKFPYCNQGDINAIEPLREAITKASEKYGIPRPEVEKVVINEINKIFINYESERNR